MRRGTEDWAFFSPSLLPRNPPCSQGHPNHAVTNRTTRSHVAGLLCPVTNASPSCKRAPQSPTASAPHIRPALPAAPLRLVDGRGARIRCRGKQLGNVPAHIDIDFDRGLARWVTAEDVEER